MGRNLKVRQADGTFKIAPYALVIGAAEAVTLYDNGVDNTVVTGGWDGEYAHYSLNYHYLYEMTKLTMNSNSMSGYLIDDGRVFNEMQMCYRSPANAIDVTGYASINVLWDFDQYADDDCFVAIRANASRDYRDGEWLSCYKIYGGTLGRDAGPRVGHEILTSGTDKITLLDVSDINGEVILTVDCTLSDGALPSAAYTSVTVKKIWMEPLPEMRVRRIKDYRVAGWYL